MSAYRIVLLNMAVFWDVAPCSLMDIDRRFRGAYCHHPRFRVKHFAARRDNFPLLTVDLFL
jgi:hypothetical protein